MIDSPEDRSKFEIMYLEYRDTMYGIAYDILHNVHDAEDAVHYAFVKLAENIQKIGDPKCPKTKGYIVTIVENRAIDIYRTKQLHPTLPYADEVIGIQVEYHGANRLADCILKLPARQRHIIILRYSHGYKLKEIAKLLGISYANALKTEQRAKTKLMELCEEAGIEW
jgi:RNA polymerase sigma-70 factor (ECF subfamily)